MPVPAPGVVTQYSHTGAWERMGETMSPVIFRHKNYGFLFFSREEKRPHIHVQCEAKFWLEPVISLVKHHGLSIKQLREIEKLIKERNDEIISAWKKHFER
ncbi:MAG: DUF4160 domain-containing protein [Planctomycetota bacterium]